ncbi:MAG: hypothetical protein HY823_10340 [Acidobacteria bacterium]|nr:hypothetical protein [Acidobacteriota bacterium]
MRTFLASSVLTLLAFLAFGCGGGGGGGTSSPPPPTITVSVSPATSQVGTGGNVTFAATVTGTTNTAVTWSVVQSGGGTITAQGLYTAPASATGTFHVEAKSQADTTKTATAAVTVYQGGSLRIWQVGLPTGAVAAIQIAGPSSFAATTTKQDQTFAGLLPGSYTLAIPSVSAGGTTWTPIEPGPSATLTVTGGQTNGFGVSFVPQPPVGVGSIAATGSTASNHIDLAAVLLPNGKVLVAGGVTTASEEYDPATGTFSSTANLMPFNHGFETRGVLLGNGQVLVAGGGYPSPVSNAELYNPATRTWTATSPMGTPRANFTLTALQDGRAMAIGGETTGGAILATTEIFNPATGTWTPSGNLTSARRFHGAVLLGDGRLLVVGGQTGPSTASKTAEIFDPATGQFTAVASTMATEHYNTHRCLLLPSGKVVVVSGVNSVLYALAIEVFTPGSNTFASPASLLLGRMYAGASVLPDGRVFISGGSSEGDAISSTEIFNPADGSIRLGPNMTLSRQEHESVTLPNGKVLLVGGRGVNNTARKIADLYTP